MKSFKTHIHTKKTLKSVKRPTKRAPRLQVRSRHPSAKGLRGRVLIPYNAIYRHGSTSPSSLHREINSVVSVENAASKLRMKQSFDKGKVKHLPWCKLSEAKVSGKAVVGGGKTLEFPVIVKSHFGSRGKGNYKIDSPEAFTKFQRGNDNSHYIVEEYFPGAREYRVHITRDGSVYCLRKMLKSDTPKDERWSRHNDNCAWIMQFQPSQTASGQFLGWRKDRLSPEFDQPVNWDKIIEECKKALIAVGGDIMAVDLKVHSATDKHGQKRKDPDFYVIEINSAPSFGNVTLEVYKQEIPKILQKKYG